MICSTSTFKATTSAENVGAFSDGELPLEIFSNNFDCVSLQPASNADILGIRKRDDTIAGASCFLQIGAYAP